MQSFGDDAKSASFERTFRASRTTAWMLDCE
jgi:hypothetical protein